eukprot:9140088-Ditylum_brightwellii.AAC.1
MNTDGLATQAEYPDPDWEDDAFHLDEEEEAVTEMDEEVAEKEADKEDEAVMIEVDKAKGKRANGVLGQKQQERKDWRQCDHPHQ